MPVWRFSVDTHAAMRTHKPFVHSLKEDGSEHVVPLFHFAPSGKQQHDGSFIVHMSRNLANWMTREGFTPEFIHPAALQFHQLHHELARKIGIWSVWSALGGKSHDPHSEPSAPVKAAHQQWVAGTLSDTELLERLAEVSQSTTPA